MRDPEATMNQRVESTVGHAAVGWNSAGILNLGGIGISYCFYYREQSSSKIINRLRVNTTCIVIPGYIMPGMHHMPHGAKYSLLPGIIMCKLFWITCWTLSTDAHHPGALLLLLLLQAPSLIWGFMVCVRTACQHYPPSPDAIRADIFGNASNLHGILEDSICRILRKVKLL